MNNIGFMFCSSCCSVIWSCLTLSDPMDCSMSRPPWPSLSPGVCSDSCQLSQWCHPTISCSVGPFSSCLQSFPTSGSLSRSQLFTSVNKGLELQFQHQSFQWIFRVDFFRIDWFDLFVVQGTLKSLLQHHNSKVPILWHSAFFYGPTLTSTHDYWKNQSFDYMEICQQSNVFAF